MRRFTLVRNHPNPAQLIKTQRLIAFAFFTPALSRPVPTAMSRHAVYTNEASFPVSVHIFNYIFNVYLKKLDIVNEMQREKTFFFCIYILMEIV